MTRNSRYFISSLFLLALLTWAGCDIFNDDSIEDPDQDNHAFDVQQTSDGGYIIVGSTSSFTQTLGDIYLVKVDSEGDKDWSKVYGGDLNDAARAVLQTSDGGYIITGYINRAGGGAGTTDLYLLKVDAEGEAEWHQSFGESSVYGSTYDDEGYSIQATTDGGYIITGISGSSLAFSLYLVKTDAEGNEIWSSTFGGAQSRGGVSVQQTADGAYIVAGFVEFSDILPNDMYLLKVDESGAEVWDRSYGSQAKREEAVSIVLTDDGGFLVAGSTDSTGNIDHYLVKTDSAGNEEWSRILGGANDDWMGMLRRTSDGGYILVGTTFTSETSSNDFLLLKLDASGEEVWRETMGGTGDEWCRSVRQTSDGGYILTGITREMGEVTYNIWLVKTDAQGDLVWDRTYTAKNK